VDAPHLWRKAPYALLLGCLLVFGCVPRLLTDKIQHSVKEGVVASFRGPLSVGWRGGTRGEAGAHRYPPPLPALHGLGRGSGGQLCHFD
jgi:hypothetical protein